MAQTFISLDGDRIDLPMDKGLAKLRKALPTDHPVVKEIAEIFETAAAHLEELSDAVHGERAELHNNLAHFVVNDHDHLVHLLQDWRRGIRDWDEVEEELKHVGLLRELLDDDGVSVGRVHPLPTPTATS